MTANSPPRTFSRSTTRRRRHSARASSHARNTCCETRDLDLPVDAQARFLGVLAAFRDIRTSHWRALSHAPEKKLIDLLRKGGVTISIGKDSVTLAVKD